MDNVNNCFDLKIFWEEKDGAKSSTDIAYYNADKLKIDVVNTLNRFENDGEIFITLRDRVLGVIVLSAVIHDLNNLKQSNEYIDLKRFIAFAVDDYNRFLESQKNGTILQLKDKCYVMDLPEFKTKQGVF
jgi:hypothetical protein